MADSIRERVCRGAALLDEARPGWAAEIVPDRLFMDSCCLCVLAQLYGDYSSGLEEALQLPYWEPHFLVSVKYGFTAIDQRIGAGEFAAMAAEWKTEISARLHHHKENL